MAQGTCSVTGCGKPTFGHGLCQSHNRYRRLADPDWQAKWRPLCSIEGCSKPARMRGWCEMHYNRWRRHGDPLYRRPGPAVCSADDCEAPARTRGLCDLHYGRTLRPTRPRPPKARCSIDGCTGWARARGWCTTHYGFWRDYGCDPGAYEDLLRRQNGRCAICETAEPGGQGNRLHIDHDHATGGLRGLLCTRCNAGIGFFGDDPGLLRKAADYLEACRELGPNGDVGLYPRRRIDD